MPSWKLVSVAVIAIAVFALSTGCGSDSGDDSSTNASASADATIAKADFITAANEACEARSDEIKAKGERVYQEAEGKARSAGAQAIIEEVVAPGFEGEIEDLRALTPPPGDKEEIEELLVAMEETVDRMRNDLALKRFYPYRKTENLAAAYGLPACGHP